MAYHIRPRTAPTSAADLESNSAQSSSTFSPPKHVTLYPTGDQPSFTFVCLGVGGGPLENDCSCYLLKPAQREWSEGAIVVEGGSWLGALTRVLENVGPNSAFADVNFPHDNSALRAGYLGSFAHSFLISHAHLDHILGLVLGSASLPGKRNVYGLRPTLENLKDVFNGKIWPKLASFEDEGPAVYLLKSLLNQESQRVDDDFLVLPFALSHGLNPSVPPAPPTPTPPYIRGSSHFSKRYSLPLNGYFPNIVQPVDKAFLTNNTGEKPTFTSPFAPERTPLGKADMRRIGEETLEEPRASPKSLLGPNSSSRSSSSLRLSRRPKTALGSEQPLEGNEPGPSQPLHTTLSSKKIAGSGTKAPPRRVSIDRSPPALDSTAFFITNTRTGKDVLFFGDVEPDCVSRSPRNKKVWTHAAKRYAEGNLNTIFLECSFPASHPTEFLYGHLSVNHLFDELRTLSKMVLSEQRRQRIREQKSSPPLAQESSPQFLSNSSQLASIPTTPMSANVVSNEDLRCTLQDLHVVIVHIKAALFPSYRAPANISTPSSPNSGTTEGTAEESNGTTTLHDVAFEEPLVDPRTMPDRILEELNGMEMEAGLGVHFVIAKQGMKIEC